MRSQGVLAAVGVALVLGSAWFLMRGGDDPGLVVPEAPSPAAGLPNAAPVAPAVGGVDAAAVPGHVAEAAERSVAAPPAGERGGEPLCAVRGRLVDRAGAPRADVEIGWSSWRIVGEVGGVPLPGDRDKPAPGQQGKVHTDRDGRFRFPMAKGRGGSLELDVAKLVFRGGEAQFSTQQGDAELGELVVVAPSRLTGTVVDAAGRPVADVTVSATSGTASLPLLGVRSDTKTDAQGRFEVGALHAGHWTVRTLSARFLPARVVVELGDEEQKADLKIALEQGQSIAGQVVDDRGVPVAGIQVGAMRRERSGGVSIERFTPDESATTDDGGFFVLGGLTGTQANVRAHGRGYVTATADNVAIGTGDLLLQMTRRGGVAGVLRDVNGKPIAGSRVRAAPARGTAGPPAGEGIDFAEIEELDALPAAAGGALGAVAVTAADGSFRLADVTPGNVVVRASGRGHRPAQSQPLAIAAAQVVEGVVVIAELGASVQAIVVDEDGKPIADAKVEVRTPQPAPQPDGVHTSRRVRIAEADGEQSIAFGDGPQRLGSATTDAAGTAVVAGLPSGAAVVACSHPQFADARPVPAVVPAQGGVEARLVLRRPGSAHLVVTAASGAASAASYVVHGPLGDREAEQDRSGTTGGDGSARLERLPAGDYWAELRLAAKPREMGGATFVLGNADRPIQGTRVPFRVDAGSEAEVALRMPVLTRLFGRVTGVDGAAKDIVVALEASEGAGDARVPELSGHEARTDALGNYELADVMPGRYQISWGKRDQMVKATAAIEVPAGQAELQRDLELRYGKLRVQVVGKDDGEGVEGAEVEIAVASEPGAPPRTERRVMMISMVSDGGGGGESTSLTMGQARAETDVDGVAEIADVPPGRYTVRIRHDRFAQRELRDQTVAERSTTDCGRVELNTAGKVRGRVLGADGKPTRMALVTCRKKGDAGEPERRPVLNGEFTFGGLVAGTYELRAQPLGSDAAAPGAAVEVEVTAGKTTGGVEVALPAR